jgi:hypothetical protein
MSRLRKMAKQLGSRFTGTLVPRKWLTPPKETVQGEGTQVKPVEDDMDTASEWSDEDDEEGWEDQEGEEQEDEELAEMMETVLTLATDGVDLPKNNE